mgnify:FL=1
MTEIIQLTGNKSEFANYITDPIVLKEDSKVCLNKASFSIPVMVNRDNFFPKAEAGIANYDGTFFYVLLNGIDKPVSYQNFYDAYDNLDLLGNPTIAEFYSGVFNNYVDNLAILEDAAGNNYDIITFTDIIANACDTLFDFYEFHTQNKMEVTNLGDYEQAIDITVNGTNIKKIKDNRSITKFGIVAQYEPRKMTNITSTAVAWTAPQVENFTTVGDGIVSASGTEAMAVCPNTFDTNGGYIAATPQINAGKGALGIVFVTKGHDDPLNITAVYQPTNFDVGIEFELLGSGERVLQIIDGNQKFVYYDSTLGAEVVTVKPNFVPANKIFTWDHNVDKFWFLVRKGRPMNGTTEFTTTIIQGPGATPGAVNNRVIYVAKTTLNTSQIQIQTLAYSEGAGNGFDNWEFIPVSDDSKAEDDYLLNPATDREGIDGAQILQIQPAITNTDFSGERAFWDFIGISQVENNTNVIQGTTVGWNATVSWNLPKNIEKSYWIGTNKFGDIIAPEITFAVLPNYSSSLKVSDIPREIAVSILDLPIAPNVGSFIGATNQYDTGNINKVVNYIQTDASQLDLESNGTLDYVYEAFNLVYRNLHNQQKMPITQMKIKLNYKNFADDRDQQIPTISGVAKLEILFD